MQIIESISTGLDEMLVMRASLWQISAWKSDKDPTGIHFTDKLFYRHIQLRWKFHFIYMQSIFYWTLNTYAHDSTSMLSWYVQNLSRSYDQEVDYSEINCPSNLIVSDKSLPTRTLDPMCPFWIVTHGYIVDIGLSELVCHSLLIVNRVVEYRYWKQILIWICGNQCMESYFGIWTAQNI